MFPRPGTSYRAKTSRCDHGPSIWQERLLSAGTISAWTGHQLHRSEPGLWCHWRTARVAEGWTALQTSNPCDHPSLDSHGPPSPLPTASMSPRITLNTLGWAWLCSFWPHAYGSEELSSNTLIGQGLKSLFFSFFKVPCCPRHPPCPSPCIHVSMLVYVCACIVMHMHTYFRGCCLPQMLCTKSGSHELPIQSSGSVCFRDLLSLPPKS